MSATYETVEGGVAAAMHNVAYQDSWEVHFADTLKGGKLINNWRMAELHAKESPERVLELQRLQRADELEASAIPDVREARVGMGSEWPLVDPALPRAIENGAPTLWESTGDGTSLAYDAGAQLRDMEMVQFHPMGMVWPAGVRGILVTEGVRGEGGVLCNKEGERFMERYDRERMELSSRDVVARPIRPFRAAADCADPSTPTTIRLMPDRCVAIFNSSVRNC
jgi:succinate dehydrogenase/fumarate reductase flavoprotein subunit